MFVTIRNKTQLEMTFTAMNSSAWSRWRQDTFSVKLQRIGQGGVKSFRRNREEEESYNLKRIF